VLNAKQHENEAKVVALAGHKGSVTVATNMAGRGTDIMLGGSVEFLADQELRKQGLEPGTETADEYDAAWPAMVERIQRQVAAEHDQVKEVGGLYVVGTERHESRRIDNQLRGRSGRQGDPGESRFYLSLQDELMRLFKADWVDRILTVMRIPDDVPIENKRVTNAIASAQGQVESQNFESRKNVLKYDDVMDRQRKVIYGERREVLEGANLEEQIRGFLDDVVEAYVTTTTEGLPEEWDLEQLWTELNQLYPVGIALATYEHEHGGRVGIAADDLIKDLQADAQEAYDRRQESVGEEVMREVERQVVLSVLDRKWREHLYEMDYLREGIYLRAYSQRDPLVEYQREGFDMFAAMMNSIKAEAVGFLFNLEIQVQGEDAEQEPDIVVAEPMRQPVPSASAPTAPDLPTDTPKEAPAFTAPGLQKSPQQPQRLTYSAPREGVGEIGDEDVEVKGQSASNADDPYGNTGRNADCPCGSGKKFKKCHGAPGGPTGLTARANG
jgi:preprotein translocase subunit SecA